MRRLAAALLLAVLAAGCATSGSGSGSGAPTSDPPTSTPAPTLPHPVPTPPPEPTGPLTLSGVVERGVEPGCLVLRSNGKSYTLLGSTGSSPATGVPLAVPVRVTGSVATGMASYCQQGTLIKVVKVSRG